MYPALNITAQGGLNAFKASNWFNLPGSLFGMAAGSVVQPVLQGKQLKTRYEQSKIMVEQAELNFKQSLLVAATEVSDALIRIQKLEEQEAISLQMVDRAGVMVNNSLTLFRYNNASYLEVILAQTNKLQADLGLATTKTLKLQSIANLYRALGGGWK
jgi:outer membrane protein TolC